MFGAAAGPVRNRQMLDIYPEATVIAFPGGRGTKDMVDEARRRGRHVVVITQKRKKEEET
jgi:hypothetical protein